ncbi:MAG TPA: hypothetical protein VKF62_14180 [Planctomycetota bacterium]|nr:hypothetical protein [Planctomycetota bacterium]
MDAPSRPALATTLLVAGACRASPGRDPVREPCPFEPAEVARTFEGIPDGERWKIAPKRHSSSEARR